MPARLPRKERRHAGRRGVGAVGRAERVVDVDVGEGRELEAERRVVALLAGVEAQVLEEDDPAGRKRSDGFLRLLSDAVACERDGGAEAYLQRARHGSERVLRVARALRLAEVRGEDEAGAALAGEVERGQRLDHARVVPHDAVLRAAR